MPQGRLAVVYGTFARVRRLLPAMSHLQAPYTFLADLGAKRAFIHVTFHATRRVRIAIWHTGQGVMINPTAKV